MKLLKVLDPALPGASLPRDTLGSDLHVKPSLSRTHPGDPASSSVSPLPLLFPLYPTGLPRRLAFLNISIAGDIHACGIFRCVQGKGCLSYDPIPVEMSSVQSHVGTCRGHLSRRAEHRTFVSSDQGLNSSGRPQGVVFRVTDHSHSLTDPLLTDPSFSGPSLASCPPLQTLPAWIGSVWVPRPLPGDLTSLRAPALFHSHTETLQPGPFPLSVSA